VAQMMDVLGVFHATLAQLFLVLVSVLTLMTSRWWRKTSELKLAIYDTGRLRYVFGFVTTLIMTQLILGASMRHQHAGLAIPDFPSAYGKWWPATDAESIARYNRDRVEVTALNPITAAQVTLQMTHRAMALCVLVSVAWLAGLA